MPFGLAFLKMIPGPIVSPAGRDTFTNLTDALAAFEKLVDKYQLQLQRRR